MKKITFNTLPEAISELIVRIEKIEKILSKRADRSTEKTSGKKGTKKRQESTAGLLGIKEAGKLLKMSVINLYSYVKNKKIPFEKRGRRLFFSKTALENWMKARNQQISADHITIKDAEKLLKVSATTIYYKIRSQKLKPAARRGNKLYFSKKELINAFSKPIKRGRKASKAKPVKAKSTKTTKTTKVAKPKKALKGAKRGRPVKSAIVTKPESNGAKTEAPKPAPAKPSKPVTAKAAKPAKVKKAAPAKKAKKQKPTVKAKPAKPSKKPSKAVPAAPTPAPAAAAQTEKSPEPPAPQANNQSTENGNKQ